MFLLAKAFVMVRDPHIHWNLIRMEPWSRFFLWIQQVGPIGIQSDLMRWMAFRNMHFVTRNFRINI